MIRSFHVHTARMNNNHTHVDPHVHSNSCTDESTACLQPQQPLCHNVCHNGNTSLAVQHAPNKTDPTSTWLQAIMTSDPMQDNNLCCRITLPDLQQVPPQPDADAVSPTSSQSSGTPAF